MPTLSVFDSVSLDGYFTDPHGDNSWAHSADPEWNQFVAGNASAGGMLLFGRKTYEQMISFWPTPQAEQVMPVVARAMNAMPKVVFSRTLEAAGWSNTRLVRGNLVEEVQALKAGDGPNMTILGSGTIVAQLAQAGLIDTYQIVVLPLVLGAGRTLFESVTRRVPLNLVRARPFTNGNVVLEYSPA
jgi:dihydrofolate reductase